MKRVLKQEIKRNSARLIIIIVSKGKVLPVLLLNTTPLGRMGEWRYTSTHS
jgi:hypothetical protein